MSHYSAEFYNQLDKQASSSSKIVVPVVFEKLKPNSVLDVGCGVGSWLREWSNYVDTVYGVDGKWVDETSLVIPHDVFKMVDLESTFDLQQQFDLATCLEVAEHITEQAKDKLVDSLVTHSDIILFSAAIPEQGGDNHYNEQWPSYWIRAFEARGYAFLDPFRHLFWQDDNIRYYYRQNIILFAKKEVLASNPFLTEEANLAHRSLVDVIHPKNIDYETRSVSKVWPIFKKTLVNAVKNRIIGTK